MKLKRGDSVTVISGKAKGTQGKIEKIETNLETGKTRVIVAGVNIVKRHQKQGGNRPGGIIEKPAPIDVSNVMLVCPNCNLRTRVSIQEVDGKRKRMCKKCGKKIDK